MRSNRQSQMQFLVLIALGIIVAAHHGAQADEEISFNRDVLPILAKSGCNSGGCHGALAGKGGFRLSLFGYDPQADYLTITRESRGRRVDLFDPGSSLFLTKPTTAIAHKGGKRFDATGDEYKILATWISQGCPPYNPDESPIEFLEVSPSESVLNLGDSRTVTVTARYADGTSRDVTRWCRFTSIDETVATIDERGVVAIIGRGEGAISAWFSSKIALARVVVPFATQIPPEVYSNAPRNNVIDDLVLEQLEKLHLKPSPSANDATFIRRAYLDTIGRLPSPEEASVFVADRSPGKHERLADLLLARPEFIDYWTYKWSDVFLLSGAKLRPNAIDAYYGWIRDRVSINMPWDQLVRELVTAKGSSIENGATNFFAVHQDPETMAENVSQAFLSLSIGCAKCHNHPLEKWTNDQYYAFANLFSRVRAKGWGGDPRSGSGIRTLYSEDSGDLIQPRTGRPLPPAPLDAESLDPNDPSDRRESLARWLTAPENSSFTRSIANRIWANFLGLGLVEPIDDLRTSNPATNEKLLAALAEHLRAHRYDLKSLMRLILVSNTYRRSSEVLPENKDDLRWHARAYPKRLMAEVLSDAISDVTGVHDSFTEIALNDGSTEKITGYGSDTRAMQLRDSAVKNYFLKTFGRNARDITCECERSHQPSLVQVLHLANGSTINDKLSSQSGRITALLAADPKPEELVRQAWMLCLSRMPSETERKEFEAMLTTAAAPEKRQVVEDMYWSLLTSREFLFRH